MTCGFPHPWVPALWSGGWGLGAGVQCRQSPARHTAQHALRVPAAEELLRAMLPFPIPWLCSKDPHLKNYGGIMKWRLFSEDNANSETWMSLQWNSHTKPSPWQLDNSKASLASTQGASERVRQPRCASQARLQRASRENAKTSYFGDWIVLFPWQAG